MLARDALMRLAIAVMVALGLLAQGAAPPLAGPAADPFWALGGICGPGHGPDGPSQDRHHHHGACCQLGPVAFLLPGSPAVGRSGPVLLLDREIASQVPRFARARPAYASRAPPGLG
jgi:hypothetical protein